MRNYRNYTDNDVIQAASQVKSMASLLKKIGIKPVGGNYVNMKKNLQRLNINCDHWTGQAWNRGERLKNWKDYSRANSSKKHLIKKRGNICEICKTEIWNGELINLEVHHLNGDRTNNDDINLQLLCPNCHSFTKNFRGKKPKLSLKEYRKLEIIRLSDLCSCGNRKRKSSTNCRKCASKIRKEKMVGMTGLEPAWLSKAEGF